MTKMPLGAKLTQNDSNVIFEMDVDMRLKQGPIQINWKDSTNFQGLKWVWMQEMTKIPFFMNFANNIEIKCREVCNWSEKNSNVLKCKKMFLDDLKCKKT